MRWVRRLAIILAVAVAAEVGGSWVAAWALTSPHHQSVGNVPAELPRETRSVRFEATDGVKLTGWLIPRQGADTAFVLLHGHNGTRRQMIARARLLHEQGFAVLLYDARGDGESEGRLLSAGYLETADLRGALRFLETSGYQKIGCLGVSQGAATIALAAGTLPGAVRWVILESCYPTMADAIDRRFRHYTGLPGALAGSVMVWFAERRLGLDLDRIAPIRQVPQLHCPVLIMGGEADERTLPESTRALFAAAPEPKELWIVPAAQHVDLYGFAHGDYEQHLLGFLSRHGAPNSGRSR